MTRRLECDLVPIQGETNCGESTLELKQLGLGILLNRAPIMPEPGLMPLSPRLPRG